jgi:hypothetical protein
MDLERFKPEHWWNVVAVAGGLIAVAAVSAQFVAAFLIGLGLLSFGVGEWINHPQRTEIARSVVVGMYAKTRSNPWKPTVFGLLLDALGVGLFVLGVFRLLMPSAP